MPVPQTLASTLKQKLKEVPEPKALNLKMQRVNITKSQNQAGQTS